MSAADERGEQLERVAYSVRRYRRAHRGYERNHPEIFNAREQGRLRESLLRSLETAGGPPGRALDVGCGSGNVTRHLLELGLGVVAADVSPEFLAEVRRRLGTSVETLQLNGIDLAGVPDAGFDLVTVYSVLHHVPDYLGLVAEVGRVLRPGGVAHLDHEANERFWEKDGCVARFREELQRRELERPGAWNPARRRWQRYLMPSKYLLAIRLKLDPAWYWGREGDIHTWDHDHIEWDLIARRLRESGLEVVATEDYLHSSDAYPEDLYERYRAEGCTDMRALRARKP